MPTNDDLLNFVNFAPTLMSTRSDLNPAAWMHERIVEQINKFEEGLPDTMQAGGRLVSSSTGIAFSIDNVGYWGPDMIIFYGQGSNGEKLRLLQHTSQLNLLLVAVPRTDDTSKPRRKIGFEVDS